MDRRNKKNARKGKTRQRSPATVGVWRAGRTGPEADLSVTVPQRDVLIWSSRKVGGQAVLPGDDSELTTGRNVADEIIADERSESTKVRVVRRQLTASDRSAIFQVPGRVSTLEIRQQSRWQDLRRGDFQARRVPQTSANRFTPLGRSSFRPSQGFSRRTRKGWWRQGRLRGSVETGSSRLLPPLQGGLHPPWAGVYSVPFFANRRTRAPHCTVIR